MKESLKENKIFNIIVKNVLNFIQFLIIFIAVSLIVIAFLGCFSFTGKILADIIVYFWY